MKETFSPKEIQLDLDISDSTLRKWALSLETAGYKFKRTAHNRRVFNPEDHIVLSNFKHLVQEKNMSYENAAVIVASKFNSVPNDGQQESNRSAVTDDQQKERLEIDVVDQQMRSFQEFQKGLLEQLSTLERQNEQLSLKLDEQEKRIVNYMNEREQSLVKAFVEENKKLLSEERKKKSFFGLFKN